MLHHVGIEVEPAEIERAVELWQALGFVLVEPPESLAEFTWLERGGTQIHLMPTESPTVPSRGHTAVVAPDFEQAVGRLREAGFEVKPGRPHWGVPRAWAVAPGGHRVELMEAPPHTES
jgi:catechol 2,3-dioxygenase-like lactoylglutathione lyase family enzyme